MAPNYDLSGDEINKLARLAAEAKETAYCPYSNFRVGAALLTDTGAYHTGANVECASTPIGICAERCAIAPVVASFANKRPAMPVIRGLAVSTDIDPPASPCGMCRQFIREFCAPEMKVWMLGKSAGSGEGVGVGVGKRGEGEKGFVVMTMGNLLPMSFGPNDMDKRENKATPTFG